MTELKRLFPSKLLSQSTADEFAIGFAEWIRIKDYQTTHRNTWIGVNMEHYLTKELLEIYKKQCALIAVDELIEESIVYLSIERNKYWKKVNQEINKL